MKKPLAIGLLATAVLATTGLYAARPAQPKTMLVLDASGSMWGQINGKPKIAIAREAVAEMLDGWNGGDLGLMAYGHRRKGDCGDSEVLQALGPNTAVTAAASTLAVTLSMEMRTLSSRSGQGSSSARVGA